MYQESELSPWFDVSVHKPWAVGVYEVEVRGYTRDSDSAFAFFDGEKFCQPCVLGFCYVEESKKWANKAGHRVYKWRGLSYDPSLPRKLARRTDPSTSKEAAEKVVKSGKLMSDSTKLHKALLEHGPLTAREVEEKGVLENHVALKRFSTLRHMHKASRTGEKRGGQSVWNAI